MDRLQIGADRLPVVHALFLNECLERNLTRHRYSSWPIDGLPAEHNWDIRFASDHAMVIEEHAVLALIEFEDGMCSVQAAGDSDTGIELLVNRIRRWTGEANPAENNQLAVKFWAMGGWGPFSVYRPVDAPIWADVAENYPDSVREELEQIIKGPLDLRGGQMMMWHGLPGTGKTWALRALGREWAPWCEFEYISDPDQFLEEGSAYLLQVLLEGAREYVEEDKWRLIVLEDAGELLSQDARERTGQGLSRFLNAADGFLGQGLRTIFLVTTNEEMTDLHPAVSRPGRCFANIEFRSFTPIEAAEWLGQEPKEDVTLAEMYAAQRRQNGNPDTE